MVGNIVKRGARRKQTMKEANLSSCCDANEEEEEEEEFELF